MSLTPITETRYPRIVAGVLAVAFAGCGRKAARHDDAAPGPRDARDARDPVKECTTLFDRFVADLQAPLTQLGVSSTRDEAGLAACAKLPHAARTCLLGAKVSAAAWGTCGVEPPFTFFDATSAHEALFGAPLAPADSAAKVAALAGVWRQAPVTPLDDTITWTISASGSLVVHRTNKLANKPVDEAAKQLAFPRERLLAVTYGTTTQLAPLVKIDRTLYMSWTTGELAIPMTDPNKLALDLASQQRWIVWNAPACTLVDPHRGTSAATCAWEEERRVRAFVVTADGLAQRWKLREGLLLHPDLETFTRR